MTAPTLSNDYAIPAGYALSRANLTALFGEMATVLKALQGTASNMQVVIDTGTTQALAMIQLNIEPYLVQVQADATAAQAALVAAMDVVNAILDGGMVSATSIQETAGRVFVTPSERTAIGLIDDALAGASDEALMTTLIFG